MGFVVSFSLEVDKVVCFIVGGFDFFVALSCGESGRNVEIRRGSRIK